MSKTKKVEKVAVIPAEMKVEEISVDLVKYEKKEKKIVAITNEKQLGQANEFLVNVKSRLNRIKEIKKEYIQPLKDSIKKLEELFNEPQKNYEALETSVKRAMGDFRLEQDRLAKEEEDRIKAENDKKIKEAEKKGSPAPIVPVAKVQKTEKTLESDSGGKTTASKVVKFEITDPDSLPKKYRDLIYDLAIKKGLAEQVLRPVVKIEGMKTNIKGVRVYEDYQISASA